MKTAEEIYQSNRCQSKNDIMDAMKDYAKQVAEQALKDAADNLIEWSNEKYPSFHTARQSILSTPIATP